MAQVDDYIIIIVEYRLAVVSWSDFNLHLILWDMVRCSPVDNGLCCVLLQ